MRVPSSPGELRHVYARTTSGGNVSASALSAGHLIGGRYRTEALVAAGAMGEVWRGRDEHLPGRPCAIKAVRLGGVTVEERHALDTWFARESAVLSSLHHPAICDIRDAVEDADAHYLIMELIDGRTLADELAARGAPGLPEMEVLAWAATLCDALAYLHGHTPPVIFRDLKPQNIMRRPDGRAVLIDFGIARVATGPLGGTAIGTGGYAPPEQYQGLADAQSDVYGLAATLHHLLTGRDPALHPPFSFPPARSLVPALTPHVEAALARALSLDPVARFPSTAAFAAAATLAAPPPGDKRWSKREDIAAGTGGAVRFTAGRGKGAATVTPPDEAPLPDFGRFLIGADDEDEGTPLRHDTGAADTAWPIPAPALLDPASPPSSGATATLREVLESDAYARVESPLKIVLGKDVASTPVVADLARMPHLLIASTTGSGKSVCLNSLIACLLFHNSPERLRLLMIDPKMVELTAFNGVPHLLHPVVTEMYKVGGTLKWALKEMHRRYKLFGEAGVRDIARYNETQLEKLGGRAPANEREKPLPYIVLIIDGLGDLMMVAPEETDDGINRLASLSRAAGIHLVASTQRPTADVVSAGIKANFPARIAFRVASRADSRVIVDQPGAERLSGRGAMLYRPADSSALVPIQGTYISDADIERLVAFWSGGVPRASALERIAPAEEVPKGEGEGENGDKLLAEATKVVQEYRRASVSLLQRRLAINYGRAARLLDQLEERGIIGPSHDGRSRVVLDPPDAPDLANARGSISLSVPNGADATATALSLASPPHMTQSAPAHPQAPPPHPGRFIQVSAHLLTWPRLCACCSRPATTDVAPSYTRVSGKRVVRTNTRSWRVPVCATCAEHSSIYGRTTGATARAITWGVAILVVSGVLGAVAGSSDGAINPAFVALGTIGTIAVLVMLLTRAHADRRTAAGLLQDTCCSVAYPVVYHGWSGSVHSFHFRNGVYAQAFADANAKKML